MALICNSCGFENNEIYKYCNECGTSLPSSSREILLPGVTLGDRYEVINLIKSGGMGAVYKARDKRLAESCAIKEMMSFYTKPGEKDYVLKSFYQEATLLAQLRHLNLPRVTDHFTENGKYYLVMDLIEGEDLEVVLRSHGGKGLPEDTVVSYVIQILHVLDYLHTSDPPIVYRDIKPSNIMIKTDSGEVVLVDFGIARTVRTGSDTKKTPIGTEGYIAPEQYMGKPEPRSDIYSVGATMHHLLSGIEPAVPFQFKSLKNLNQQISSKVCNIVMKALQMKPENRFLSAKEMLDCLTVKNRNGPEEISMPVELYRKIMPELNICAECDEENSPGELFCSECGAHLLRGDYRSTDFARGHNVEEETLYVPDSWTSQNSGILMDLRGVSFIDSSTGWAAGNYGVILHTADGGISWTKQRSNVSDWLYDIHFLDKYSGIAVGVKGVIVYTKDGGNTWKISSNKNKNNLLGIHYISSSSCWAVGEGGIILNSSDCGETWTVQKNESEESLGDVYFIDSNNGWAVGKNGTILRYLPPVRTSSIYDKITGRKDKASKWVVQTNPDVKEDLYSVHFIDSSNGWAAGVSGAIIHTSDGGMKWSLLDTKSTVWLKGIHFVSHSCGWAAGSGGIILSTKNGGNTWKIQTSSTSEWLSRIIFTDESNGWIVGGRGTVLKYNL